MRAAVLVCAALAMAGCGGDRQDANEPTGEYALEVVEASFPERQTLAQPATLRIAVRNTDDRELPNLAVTVETEPASPGEAAVAFAQDADDPRLADAVRPVWVLDRGPEGGTGASTNTWAVGRISPGQTHELEWRLTAVQAGTYTVGYRISPGLYGKAVPESGRQVAGTFDVTISDDPVPARVNDNGQVVRGGG
jgi:hypothetical protein